MPRDDVYLIALRSFEGRKECRWLSALMEKQLFIVISRAIWKGG